jgi:hypothetical protein
MTSPGEVHGPGGVASAIVLDSLSARPRPPAIRVSARQMRGTIRAQANRFVTAKGRRRLRRPAIWGTIRRHGGFDPPYGQRRGTPVDRYYIEHFLAQHHDTITGDVLEVGNRDYVDRLGHDLSSVTVIDIDPSNPKATLIVDLCQPSSLPARRFDCMVVTQTLHFLPEPGVALANLRQGLKPGGTLLLTTPVASPTSVEEHPLDSWRLLPRGLRLLAERMAEPGDEIHVATYGNRVTVAAFALALALEDLHHRDLQPVDHLCPLVTCLHFRRGSADGCSTNGPEAW